MINLVHSPSASIKKTSLTISGFWFFSLAVLTIPFDNLAFAPTTGWATVSPIIFFFFYLWSLSRKPIIHRSEYRYIVALAALFAYSCFLFFLYPPQSMLVIKTIATLAMGLTFYFCLIRVTFTSTSSVNTKGVRLLARCLVFAYTASLAYGVIYIIAHKYSLSFIINLFQELQARYYGARYSFSFTEPSFSSMHVFGVILPFFLIFKKYFSEHLNSKNFFIFLCLYTFCAILLIDSIRLKIDFLAVLLLTIAGLAIEKKKYLILTAGVAVLLITYLNMNLIFATLIGIDPRLDKIILAAKGGDSLIYADASLATRFFMAQSIFYGLIENPTGLLLGYGMSNSYYPFSLGYDKAYYFYDNAYNKEILWLREAAVANYYSLPLRLISEFGLIITIAFFMFLWKRSNASIFLVSTYLLLQFDSYAFYTLWILLYANHCAAATLRVERAQ